MINRTITTKGNNRKTVAVRFGAIISATTESWHAINGFAEATDTNAMNTRFQVPYDGYITHIFIRTTTTTNQTLKVYGVGAAGNPDDLDENTSIVFASAEMSIAQAHLSKQYLTEPIKLIKGQMVAVSTTAGDTTTTDHDGMLIMELEIPDSIQAGGADGQ